MTEKEWLLWADKREDESLRSFEDSPEEYLSACSRENNFVNDYTGRELLELLQNANDAEEQNSSTSCVHIRLCSDGLIFANTGTPFSKEGVQSIRIDSISPKKGNNSLVGSKGLGFRSVLNWTSSPIILSHDLTLIYSDKVKKEKFNKILTYDSIRNNLTADDIEKQYIPILKFPKVARRDEADKYLDSRAHKDLLNRALKLLEDGFSTTIIMPFKKDSYSLAQEQINDLTPEVLLFINSISKIVFDIDGLYKTWSKTKVSENTISFLDSSDSSCKEYSIHSDKGRIPDINQNNEGTPNYEITIAVPHGNEPVTKNHLYSFFKTKEDFPFPFLCHATLELESNRKYIKEADPTNAYIISKLSSFMVNIATKLVEKENKWQACKFLSSTAPLSQNLSAYNLQARVIESIENHEIIPCVDGQFRKPLACYSIKLNGSDKWLPADNFGNCITATDSVHIHQFLKSIGVNDLAKKSLERKIQHISFNNIAERARFIAQGVINKLFKDIPPPTSLLIDENNKRIQQNRKIFLPSESSVIYSPPEWANFSFVNNELVNELKVQFKKNSNRDVVRELDLFHIQEFSLQGIVNALLSSGKNKKRSKFNTKLIKELYHMFSSEARKEQDLKFKGLTLKNKIGGYSNAHELYLSDDYGDRGVLLQDLYGSFAPQKLIANIKTLGLDGENLENVIDFLQWLGINDLPREVELEHVNGGYTDHVLDAFTYPLSLDNKILQDKKGWTSPKISAVKTIDEIEMVLKKGSIESILKWLYADHRRNEWKNPSTPCAVLRGKADGQRTSRRYKESLLPSFTYWAIQSIDWMTTEKGNMPPTKCLLLKAFEHIFPTPSLPPEFINKYREIFAYSGVKFDLNDVSWRDIFLILKELPNTDPTGIKAQKIYAQILSNFENFQGNLEAESNDFKTNGKLWGNFEGIAQYYNISDLKYISSSNIPKGIEGAIKTLAVAKRENSSHIQKVFGVNSFKISQVQYSITHTSTHKRNHEINTEFTQIKPYLYGLRKARHKSSHSQVISQFKDLSLNLFTEISATVQYLGEDLPLRIDYWDWFIVDNILHILVDERVQDLRHDLLADSIGSAIASLFKLEDGSAYSSLISCDNAVRKNLLDKKTDTTNDLDELRNDLDIDACEPTVPEKIHFSEPIEKSPNIDDKRLKDSSLLPQPKKGETLKIIDVTEGEHILSSSPRTRKQPKSIISSNPEISDDYSKTISTRESGAIGEKYAFEFEIQRGRYPLSTGHLKGEEGAGCDIFSFTTEERRRNYEKTFETKFIDRFIEVKRSTNNKKATFTEREKRRAQEAKDKFYLYRVVGNTILILQNPFSQQDAIYTEICTSIDIDRSANTRLFTLLV